MIRRDPTRIELKLDDIHEFEKKNETEQKKNGLNQSSRQQPEAAKPKKTPMEIVYERIGFDPTPRNN